MVKKYIKNPYIRGLLEWVFVMVLVGLIFLFTDNFIIKTARVDGGSMEPTYSDADRVVINLFIYFFTSPQYGDVIAFPFKADPPIHYIKRIIGLPGDTIDIIDGFIYRNGERLDDEFSIHITPAGNADFPIIIEEDTFFVLGDNRRISKDSRHAEVGNVHLNDIMGRVNFRWFPFNRFGFVRP